LQQIFKFFRNFLLRYGADDMIYNLPSLEKKECGQFTDAVGCLDHRVNIKIDFAKFDLPDKYNGQPIDDGIDNVARPTPVGGEFHYNGLTVFKHLTIKIIVG